MKLRRRSRNTDFEQLPNNQGKTQTKQPDLKINGEIADVYSPKSGNLETILDKVNENANPAEIKKFQAPNIVVNLSDSPLTAGEVAQYIQRNPVGGLKSLVLIKDGKVTVFNAGP